MNGTKNNAKEEEILQIVHQMWSGDETPYEGTYYQLARPLNSPQPIQKPHPPILVGGHGERKTLRPVAQYADACNFMGYLDKAERQRKLDILREHCQALGRPYEQIEKPWSTPCTSPTMAKPAPSVRRPPSIVSRAWQARASTR